MKLIVNALIKFLCGILLLGLLVFLPAGSFDYVGGWVLSALLFLPMLLLGIVLLIKSPDLLQKRLDHKEKEGTQRGVVALSGIMFIAGFALAGLDFRFGLSEVPLWLRVSACLIFLASYGLYAEVMRENAYLSRTVKVEKGQKVVCTGLYGIVRHPMYLATVLMFLSIPLILGSLWAVLVFLAYPVIIGVRIQNEEKLLTKELEGYAEYKKKVRWRLLPFVW